MGRGHLIKNVDFTEVVLSAILKGQNQAFNRIIDVDEGSSLFPSSIDAQWVSTGHLRAEPVQNCPKITINIDSVAEILVHISLWGADTPDYALVELCDLELEEFLEI